MTSHNLSKFTLKYIVLETSLKYFFSIFSKNVPVGQNEVHKVESQCMGQSIIFCGTLRYWIAVFALYGLMWPWINCRILPRMVLFHGHGHEILDQKYFKIYFNDPP